MWKRLALLGHIIRCENTDPMRAITFNENTVDTRRLGWRREGKPRVKWVEATMQDAWKILRKQQYGDDEQYSGTNEQKEMLKERAMMRLLPFETK